jgi:sec-independent protein translocase protein TatA
MLVLPPEFAILDIGGTEILIIMVITLLLFGSERLPGLARSMGKSIREFKKATSGLEEELRRALDTPPPPSRPPVKIPPSPAPQKSTPPAPAAPPPQPPATPPSPPENPPYPYS